HQSWRGRGQDCDQLQRDCRGNSGSPDVGNTADAKSVSENSNSFRLRQATDSATVGLNDVQTTFFRQCLHPKPGELCLSPSNGNVECIMQSTVTFGVLRRDRFFKPFIGVLFQNSPQA